MASQYIRASAQLSRIPAFPRIAVTALAGIVARAWGLLRNRLAESVEKSDSCYLPMALDRRRRKLDGHGSLFDAHATEITEFDDAGLDRIHLGKRTAN